MPEPDRSMAARLHGIVRASAPSLSPKTWYGMPAYANEDGKIVCFYQAEAKFNARYASFGFNDTANLGEGAMWPVAFALKELTPAGEARIAALVKQAVNRSRRDQKDHVRPRSDNAASARRSAAPAADVLFLLAAKTGAASSVATLRGGNVGLFPGRPRRALP